ncbi:MAG: hypothetical protein IKJ99_01005 [Oscillospiraceae bacterium]|nr:hypothetical protein [Oscillospiraceae bacterium]
MYGWLNIASLGLGLVAWLLPVWGIFSKKVRKIGAMSFSLCSISLACQIFYTQYLVTITDWSAIKDTHFAVTFAAAALLVGTILLNFAAWIAGSRKGKAQ